MLEGAGCIGTAWFSRWDVGGWCILARVIGAADDLEKLASRAAWWRLPPTYLALIVEHYGIEMPPDKELFPILKALITHFLATDGALCV